MTSSADDTPFGIVLRKHMQEKNISIYRLAMDIGKAYPTVRKQVNQVNDPRFKTVIEISRALGIEPWEFFKEMVLEYDRIEPARKTSGE